MKGARGMFTRTGYKQSQWNIPLTPFARGIFCFMFKQDVILNAVKDLIT